MSDSLVGRRVRITTRTDSTTASEPMEGQLEAIEGGSLVIQHSSTLTRIPITSVRRVDVHVGVRRSTKRGLRNGAIALGLTGLVLGLLGPNLNCAELSECTTRDKVEDVV